MLENDDTTDHTDYTGQTGQSGQTGPASNDLPPGDSPASESPGEAPAPVKKAAAKKAAAKKTAKKAAAKKTSKKAVAKTADEAADAPVSAESAEAQAPAEKPKKKAAPRKKAAAPADEGAAPAPAATPAVTPADAPVDEGAAAAPAVLFQAPETKAPRKRAAKKAVATPQQTEGAETPKDEESGVTTSAKEGGKSTKGGGKGGGKGGKSKGKAKDAPAEQPDKAPGADESEESAAESQGEGGDAEETADGDGGARRRRRRGGRRRRRSDGNGEDASEGDESDDEEESGDSGQDGGDGDTSEGTGASRRRRRRRRSGDDSGGSADGSEGPRARKQRNPEDEITSIGGSTRLEAKKQRRREGREAGRRRAPIVSEAEFLARRESVDRVMVIRQKDDLTQIGVLEDKVLVEHYVARESQTSLIGNVYLGRVQNVLPSMEAAFIDIGKGRNAVLYAGEVNWSAVGHKEGQPRKIESVLSSGQTVLVQVTKDPVGHKGARLTGQVSLPGRFLVYVPEGNTSGISRKLPDTERNRLKTLLKEIVPESAGVIVRTAAEGASEDELTRDVERLTARWQDIEEKVKAGKAPQLLYGEPDLTLKVVRDLFTEDFAKLVVQGDDAWDLVHGYVSHVAPDLSERLERFEPAEEGKAAGKDLFATYRVDEQIAKGLERKVWLPSGGSLIIDRTEAMTVVDVNTGKFTGSGGNLEETVTKNNLEAAEEIVRQLRLRDIGGIIVVDFIDMVLESNRDLVLRRLVECLGRDRTRHQVAEVTSLGLVQMTRKRIGTGLLEAFSHDCEHCKGRGVVIEDQPVDPGSKSDDDEPRGRRSRGGRSRGRGGQAGQGGQGGQQGGGNGAGAHAAPSPADLAHSRPPEKSAEEESTDATEPTEPIGAAESTEPTGPTAPDQSVIGTPSTTPPEPQVVPSSEAAASTDGSETSDGADEPVERREPVPEGPRVVTSTRRRTARRPAGPPAGAVEGSVEHGAGTPSPPSAEPVEVPVDPATPDLRDDDVAADAGEAAEAGEDPDGDGGGFSLLHVPIKRKGSRKR